MVYARFERIVVGGTALLVAFSLLASLAGAGISAVEAVGQLAIVGVMAVAVHWGRKAGTLAALAACILYLAMLLPALAVGLSWQGYLVVVAHFAGYCIVGIVGGEIFGRMKYQFAGAADASVIDDWSRVYNQRYASRAVTNALERHERYREPFAIVVLRLEPRITATQRPEKLRGVVRSVASYLRDEVRMVDDVARLDDGRFVVILPHTPDRAAPLVAGRLRDGVCHVLGMNADCVSTTHLGADEDAAMLREFAASISGANSEPAALPGVGGVEVGLDQHSIA